MRWNLSLCTELCVDLDCSAPSTTPSYACSICQHFDSCASEFLIQVSNPWQLSFIYRRTVTGGSVVSITETRAKSSMDPRERPLSFSTNGMRIMRMRTLRTSTLHRYKRQRSDGVSWRHSAFKFILHLFWRYDEPQLLPQFIQWIPSTCSRSQRKPRFVRLRHSVVTEQICFKILRSDLCSRAATNSCELMSCRMTEVNSNLRSPPYRLALRYD